MSRLEGVSSRQLRTTPLQDYADRYSQNILFSRGKVRCLNPLLEEENAEDNEVEEEDDDGGVVT